MSFEIGIQLFSNIDRKFIFNIDMKTRTVTPEKLTLEEIQASLRGDDYLDSISEDVEEDTSIVDESTQNNSDELVPNDSSKLSDFTILKSADSDEDSDYNPCEDSDSDNNDDEIVGWNVTEIQTRKYGTPNMKVYDKDRFLTKICIEKYWKFVKDMKLFHLK